MAINEITEVVLMSRIVTAIKTIPLCRIGMAGPEPRDTIELAREVFKAGNFHEFVGVVGKATEIERTRAAHTARRLGHGMTANVIKQGK